VWRVPRLTGRSGQSASHSSSGVTPWEQIALPRAPAQVALGDGVVWVTSTSGDAVLRLDASTSKVEATIRVGNGPTGIAFGADRVWVANGQDGTVSTIDPQTNEVGTLRLDFQPTAVAVVERAVWVALAA
jgi:YVTN family beta-propeller protein